MTINQILDKILSSNNSNKESKKIKKELTELKKKYGGKTKIENFKDILDKIKDNSKN